MIRVILVIFYILGAAQSNNFYVQGNFSMKFIFLFFLGFHVATKEYLVGGTRAYSGEFPYQVSIRLKDRHRCGGALITQRHVLTAAHCLVNYLPSGKFANRIGQVSVVTRTMNLLLRGDRYKIKGVYPHEGYDRDLVTNDIGIIEVRRVITLLTI